MSDFRFFVRIENSSGTILGSGPLDSALDWEYTARLDRAGTFRFQMLASDSQRAIVQNRRIARAFALLGGVWTEVGAGVIDDIQTTPSPEGIVSLEVSGLDLTRELSYLSVGDLTIGLGSGATHAAAVAAIEAYAPAGWTFTPAVAPDNDYVYAMYGGESVLGAAVHLAKASQAHFYRSVDRTLVFTSQFTASGIRAIQARGDLTAHTCAITSLTLQVDTYDLLTRITPFGSGQGKARLTLAASNRVAPAGYTLDAVNNYIEHDAATAEFGLVDFPNIEFKEITPISNTDADLQAAANMLFDNALEELRRRATLTEQQTLTLALHGCSVLLRPLHTIPVIYRDDQQGVDIDETLIVLESTWRMDASGIETVGLIVSSDDRWPESDESAAAERAVEGRVYQAHPQMNANSYVTSYNKNVDGDHNAEFRFRFGAEVVQLNQVLFEFQLLPFESTVMAVGGVSSGSGELSTTVPSTNDSGTPSSNTSGTPSTNNTSTPSTNASGAPSTNVSDTPSTNTSGDPNDNETSNPLGGGDTDGSGDHVHQINVIAGSGSLGAVSLHESGGNFYLANPFVTGSEPVYVSYQGTHVHEHDHTHTMSNHTHNLGNHTHNLGNHTHDLGNHTHTMGNHTHSLSNHVHDLSEALAPFYGIFRDDALMTVEGLEYRVNGGGWESLALVEDAGDGWYAIDITNDVYDTVTFRPLQTSNILEIRVAPIAVANIALWQSIGPSDPIEVTTSPSHGFSPGQRVTIAGAHAGTSGGNINGEYTILSGAGATFEIANSGSLVAQTGGPFGDATLIGRTTIDAQLSVRDIIQAISYTL